MACPETVTTKNLTGKLKLNKALSDGVDETLKLQGVGYLKRTAIAQLLPYTGFQPIRSYRKYNYGWRLEHPKGDDLFGPLIGKTRRVKVDELDTDFLKEDWTEDTLEDGGIYGIVKSDTEKTGKNWAVHLSPCAPHLVVP
ncbi:hypothetical protein DFH29DRAFT_1004909 [Suillus ampliporus]|nr:hypothetical protein DFH29DRAFT_1004909 [Suillus ampliporus]